jgi:membrane protein implicated in regulation of membrane protease activity
MRTRTFLLLAAGFFLVIAVAAAISGGIEWAIPIALVAIIVAVYAGANKALGERTLEQHGDSQQEAMRDADEGGLPKAHVVGDDRTPLGDTPEVHSSVSPHDIPKGAPERQAAEELAEEQSRR